MNKKKFLKTTDVNILNYYVSDTVDAEGNKSVDVFLKIGKSKKEIEKAIDNIPAEILDQRPKISISEYEILLTKEQLQFLLSEIEKFNTVDPGYLLES